MRRVPAIVVVANVVLAAAIAGAAAVTPPHLWEVIVWGGLLVFYSGLWAVTDRKLADKSTVKGESCSGQSAELSYW